MLQRTIDAPESRLPQLDMWWVLVPAGYLLSNRERASVISVSGFVYTWQSSTTKRQIPRHELFPAVKEPLGSSHIA